MPDQLKIRSIKYSHQKTSIDLLHKAKAHQMKNSEFDKYADDYTSLHKQSILISGEEPDFFAEYKIKDIAHDCQMFLNKSGNVKILDFGAGVGSSIPYIKKYIPKVDLTCIDVSQRSLDIASKKFPKLAEYIHFDGLSIPLANGSFDMAYSMCVFHHIDHDIHHMLLSELHRILKIGGVLYIFEHNPLNPLTVKIVNSCPFDENARLIRAKDMVIKFKEAGFNQIEVKYRVFFPHILRYLRPTEKALTWLPLGGQYYTKGTR